MSSWYNSLPTNVTKFINPVQMTQDTYNSTIQPYIDGKKGLANPGGVDSSGNYSPTAGTSTSGGVKPADPVAPAAPGEPEVGGERRSTDGVPPPSPWGGSFDVAGLSGWMKSQRENDMKEGLQFGDQFYGSGNPQMAEILDARRTRALGLNGAEVQGLRERASAGINSQMQTGLRANAATAAANGVHGGAAVGANAAVLARANDSRANAERDISLEDQKRRGEELTNYEKTVTGERSGLLGTMTGFADLGAGERSAAEQYGLSKDALAYYKDAANKDITPEDDSFSPQKAMDNFKKSGYDPNDTPWSQWLHQNLFDKNDYIKKITGGSGIEDASVNKLVTK